MIIARKNFRQAYLVFAANGEIRLNKKTIGLWKVMWKRIFSEDFSRYKAIPVFTADVCYGNRPDAKRHFLKESTKYNIMRKVAENIPDRMLVPDNIPS